jgi:hypothetical protein
MARNQSRSSPWAGRRALEYVREGGEKPSKIDGRKMRGKKMLRDNLDENGGN